MNGLPALAHPKVLRNIQALRAVAALLVVCEHLGSRQSGIEAHYLPGRPVFASFMTFGLFGVDIFFVISGFIMLVTSRNSTPGEFLIRRIIRVAPLYWILTTLLAVILLWHPDYFRNTVLTAAYYVESMLFIPAAVPGHGWEVAPLLIPGWSLNLEMFFYCIFALALITAERRRLLLTGIVFFSLVFAARLYRDAYDYRQWLFLGDFRVLEFWTGMCVGHLYLQGKLRMPAGIAGTILACGFATILWKIDFLGLAPGDLAQNLISNALPATLIVLGAVALEQARKIPAIRPLMFLGDASYSLYLSHIFILGAARVIWLRLGLVHDGLPSAVGFLAFCALMVLAGTDRVHRFVEIPLLTSLQRLARRVTPLRGPREAATSAPGE